MLNYRVWKASLLPLRAEQPGDAEPRTVVVPAVAVAVAVVRLRRSVHRWRLNWYDRGGDVVDLVEMIDFLGHVVKCLTNTLCQSPTLRACLLQFNPSWVCSERQSGLRPAKDGIEHLCIHGMGSGTSAPAETCMSEYPHVTTEHTHCRGQAGSAAQPIPLPQIMFYASRPS